MMKTIFDKNRNDLSKYCYDISKGALVSTMVVPLLQDKLTFSIAGFLVTVIVLVIGMMIKKKEKT